MTTINSLIQYSRAVSKVTVVSAAQSAVLKVLHPNGPSSARRVCTPGWMAIVTKQVMNATVQYWMCSR